MGSVSAEICGGHTYLCILCVHKPEWATQWKKFNYRSYGKFEDDAIYQSKAIDAVVENRVKDAATKYWNSERITNSAFRTAKPQAPITKGKQHVVGLINFNNVCYMNAVLIALYHCGKWVKFAIPSIQSWLYSYIIYSIIVLFIHSFSFRDFVKQTNSDGEVWGSLAGLFNKLDEREEEITAWEIYGKLSRREFPTGAQCDAHSFFFIYHPTSGVWNWKFG